MMREVDTVSEAVNALTKAGYIDDFIASQKHVIALISGKKFTPNELCITEHYRFEGMTDPADSAEVYAMLAADGTKGTLTMVYGAKNGQNDDLIRSIPFAD